MLSQVTHHSAIFPPSIRNTAPKSNCALFSTAANTPSNGYVNSKLSTEFQ